MGRPYRDGGGKQLQMNTDGGGGGGWGTAISYENNHSEGIRRAHTMGRALMGDRLPLVGAWEQKKF